MEDNFPFSHFLFNFFPNAFFCSCRFNLLKSLSASFSNEQVLEPVLGLEMHNSWCVNEKRGKSAHLTFSFFSLFLVSIFSGLSLLSFPLDSAIVNGVFWSEALNKVFVDNFERDPSLIWQYFGSAKGFFRQYPGKTVAGVLTDCVCSKIAVLVKQNSRCVGIFSGRQTVTGGDRGGRVTEDRWEAKRRRLVKVSQCSGCKIKEHEEDGEKHLKQVKWH